MRRHQRSRLARAALLLSLLTPACTDDSPMSEPLVASQDSEAEDTDTERDDGDTAAAGAAGQSQPGKPARARPGAPRLKAVSGSAGLAVDDVDRTTKAIIKEVEEKGGEILEERASANVYRTYNAYMHVKIPAAETAAFLKWLEKRGRLLHKSLATTDMTRPMSDVDQRIQILEGAIARLQELIKDRAVTTADLLKAEKELRRLMDDLDRLRAAKAQMAVKIAYSHLRLDLTDERYALQGRTRGPAFRIGPVAQRMRLGTTRPGDRALGTTDKTVTATADGAGVDLVFGRAREFSIDTLVLPGGDDLPKTTVLSFGPSFYSYVFGSGTNTFLNPYITLRLGYLTNREVDSGFAAIDLGLELYKNEWMNLAVTGRAMVPFAQKKLQNGQGAGVSLLVPF